MTAVAMLPVSFSQELLWLINRAAPDSSAYNVPRTRRLVGPLDVTRLRRAFDQLVVRHEILRTTYGLRDERPVQLVHAPRGVTFAFVDLTKSPAAERGLQADRLVREWSAKPFDLARETPLRVGVIRLSADEHVLHIDTHHIASDGGSRDILLGELDVLYRHDGDPERSSLPPLPVQYADYAVWEREELSGPRLEALLGYWRDELGGVQFALDLPTDFPRPQVPRDEAITRSLLLPKAVVEQIVALGRRYDATLYMTLLAGYQSILHRYSGQSDILVGLPVAGRTLPETEALIGYFARTVVSRARFGADPTFGELLSQVRKSCLGAYDHGELPFEKIVLDLDAGKSLTHSPLFQAVFTMLEQTDPDSGGRIGDVTILSYGSESTTTKFDLTLFMAERAEGVLISLRARASLWSPGSVERFLGHLQTLLEAAVADPNRRVSALPLLTTAEEREALGFNATTIDTGAPKTLNALIEATIARVPERLAAVAADGALTYAELDARATRLACALRRSGVIEGDTVGILIDRSVHAIVALLGVLKAGAAYVPLSPEIPAARIADQIAEGGMKVVVTLAADERAFPTATVLCIDRDDVLLAEQARDLPEPAPESVAYVLFTSGSTGVPKGVAVTHANAVHYTRAISRVLGDVAPGTAGAGLGALDGWHFASAGTLATDLGNTAILPALCAGGTLHLIPRETSNDAERFAAYLAEHPIDVLKITPGHFRALRGDDAVAGAYPYPRRWLVLGGEALPLQFAESIVESATCRLLNHYGPTETTVGACTFEVTAESLRDVRAVGARTVPIGTPLANMRCDVLDAHGRAVPVGVPGELVIGGAGVARGYVNNEELTAKLFIASEGCRSYRTGDRVRRLPGGLLEFLGRRDDQLKVRGNRVELGELESLLAADPAVAQAAVRAWTNAAGETELMAYVVSGAGPFAAQEPECKRLRSALAARLPEYMLPRTITFLETMPLQPNGKVDRAALPHPDDDQRPASPVGPRTETEAALVAIWGDAMHRDPATFGVADHFIALGGHSLLAIRILGKVKRQFRVGLGLRALFDAPTIAELAALIDREIQDAAQASIPAEPALVRAPRLAYRPVEPNTGSASR